MGARKNLPPIGDPSDPRGFEVLIERYLEWREIHLSGARSTESIRWMVRSFARWCEERGMVKPSEVSRESVERYQSWLYHHRQENGKPLGWSSQSGRLSAVKVFFKYLTRERYLLYSPASEVLLPRMPMRLPVDGLTLAEVEAVLSTPNVRESVGLRDRALLEVLYATGIRRMEAVNLNLYDAELERGYLVVRQGKGGRDRVVPMGERAVSWLRRYSEEVRPSWVIGPDELALFLSQRGSRFNRETLGLLVKKLLQASGIRPRRGACHLFRHTMATLMLEGGADVRYVQEMLGHVKIETTTIYTHVSIDRLAQVHRATHPGARLMPADGAHAATREELMAALAAEAAAEATEE